MRTPMMAGNWKMNNLLAESRELARGIAEGARGATGVDIVVAPPALSMGVVREAVAGSAVHLAAQNCHWAAKGAYTAELSPPMLRDAGCSHVILGHSERREHFSETDELINQKVKAAIGHDLTVILCCGETLGEREGGKTDEKIDFQVRAGLSGVREEDLSHVVVAYEPIWAIGTGRTASPEQAQEVHAKIRSLVAALYNEPCADRMRILYGGSVKPANIEGLIAQPDIDGGLVGGASLKADSFLALIRAVAR